MAASRVEREMIAVSVGDKNGIGRSSSSGCVGVKPPGSITMLPPSCSTSMHACACLVNSHRGLLWLALSARPHSRQRARARLPRCRRAAGILRPVRVITCIRIYPGVLDLRSHPCSSASCPSATSPATPSPAYTPSEAERIGNIVTHRRKAEEVGLDVFAIGEHHNPPFFSSSPTTLLAHIGALTERLILTTSTTLITTNDPVRIAEEYAMLQHLWAGAWTSCSAAATPARSTRGLARTSARGFPSRSRTTTCCTACGARTWSTGRAASAPRCRDSRRRRARSTTCRRSCGTARSAPPRSPSRPPTTATATSPTTSSGPRSTTQRMVALLPPALRALRPRHRQAGDRRAGRPGVHRQDHPGGEEQLPALLQRGPRLRPRPDAGGVLRADAAGGGLASRRSSTRR